MCEECSLSSAVRHAELAEQLHSSVLRRVSHPCVRCDVAVHFSLGIETLQEATLLASSAARMTGSRLRR